MSGSLGLNVSYNSDLKVASCRIPVAGGLREIASRWVSVCCWRESLGIEYNAWPLTGGLHPWQHTEATEVIKGSCSSFLNFFSSHLLNFYLLKRYVYGAGMDDVEGHFEYSESAANPLDASKKGWYTYIKDQVGTVYQVYNDYTKQVVDSRVYDSFGNLTSQTGTSKTNLGFQGKYFDQETGLYYYHRYYSPSIGRFTTEDPIGFNGGLNFYGFVGNGPVNILDPWGLRKCNEQQRNFFADILASVEEVAKRYNFDPNFLLSISAHESGWLGKHGRELNNAFGLTAGGGRNLKYNSLADSVENWGSNFGEKARGATTMKDFIDKLQKDQRPKGKGAYNSVDSEWANKVNAAYNSVISRRGDPTCEPKPCKKK